MITYFKQCRKCGTRISGTAGTNRRALKVVRGKGWSNLLGTWYCRKCYGEVYAVLQFVFILAGAVIGVLLGYVFVW